VKTVTSSKYKVEKKFDNITYSPSDDTITYQPRTDYNKVNSTQANDEAYLLNLGALSANYLLSDKESFKEIYSLLRDSADKMTDNLVPYVFAMNAYYTAFNDSNVVMKSVLKDIKNADQIFADEKEGFGSVISLSKWIRAIEGGEFSEMYAQLKSHFNLNDNQMQQIAGPSSFLKALYSATKVSYALEYDCKKFCDNTTMFAIQWASQNITNNADTFISPKVEPRESIFDIDDTLVGAAPELSYAMKKLGKQAKPLNLTQTLGLASVASFDDAASIFNPKNLYDFFSSYQAGRYENIKIKFKLDTEEQIDAIHSYLLDYVIPKLGNYEDKQGTKQHKAFARMITHVISKTEENLANYLPADTFARYIGAGIINDKKKCSDFVGQIIKEQERVTTACTQAPFETFQGTSLWAKAYFLGQGSQYWQNLIHTTNLTSEEVGQILDSSKKNGYGAYAKDVISSVSKEYKCSSNPCSPSEMAHKQFMDAGITSKVVKYKGKADYLVEADSILAWNYTREVAMEFNYLASTKCKHEEPITESIYEALTKGEDSLSIYKNAINFVIDVDQGKKIANHTDTYGINATDLFCIFRYMVQDSMLGGILVKKAPEDFIFGYDEPTLGFLAEGNFTKGADPSVQKHVSINDVYYNRTLINDTNIEIYTGNRHPEKVKTTRSINGGVYINNVVPFYNGTSVIYGNINPFADNVRVKGTDGMQFGKSLSSKSHPKLFDTRKIQDVEFSGGSKKSYGDITTLKYNLKSVHKEKPKDGNLGEERNINYDGVFNVSSNFKMPIGVSQGFFAGVQESDYGATVKIDGQSPSSKASSVDNYVSVEPVSGFTIETGRNEMAFIDVHEKYYALPDLDGVSGFIPVMNTQTNINIDEGVFLNKYAFVNTYTNMKFYFRVIFFPLAGVCLISAIISFILMRRVQGGETKYEPDYRQINDQFKNESQRLIENADSHGDVKAKYQSQDPLQDSTKMELENSNEGDSSP
jgi:hypothetical protein